MLNTFTDDSVKIRINLTKNSWQFSCFCHLLCFAKNMIKHTNMKMKITFLATMTTLVSMTAYSQNTFPSTGNVGIGITTPQINFQIHGTTDFIQTNKQGQSVNYGKTSRILLTNTTTTSANNKGFDLRMSGLNFTMRNQSDGDISVNTNNTLWHINALYNRSSFGSMAITTNSVEFGCFNVQTGGDNGLFIRTITANKYGMRIQVNGDNTNAIEVVTSSGVSALKNFTVQGNGHVYARKYTTTLNNIPDYVFAPTYKLMPLSDLRKYIANNNHLPNIPSAAELEAQPVDLGELTRLMLEKIEENTLYILQLEQRIKELEGNQK